MDNQEQLNNLFNDFNKRCHDNWVESINSSPIDKWQELNEWKMVTTSFPDRPFGVHCYRNGKVSMRLFFETFDECYNHWMRKVYGEVI